MAGSTARSAHKSIISNFSGNADISSGSGCISGKYMIKKELNFDTDAGAISIEIHGLPGFTGLWGGPGECQTDYYHKTGLYIGKCVTR